MAAAAVAAVAAAASAGAAFAAGSGGNPAPSGSSGSTGSTGSTGSAPAAQTWQQVHDKLAGALTDRQHKLATLTASVGSDAALSTATRQALQGLLAAETQGINQLATQVAATTPQNTTIAQLRQDDDAMVHQYRVYLVMAPKVHLSESAAAQSAAESRLSATEARLQAAIAKAGNPAAAVQAYQDLQGRLGSATAATGKADISAVLQVTPSGYPADGAPLQAAKDDLRSAQGDLKAARGDVQAIRSAVRQAGTSAGAGARGTAPGS